MAVQQAKKGLVFEKANESETETEKCWAKRTEQATTVTASIDTESASHSTQNTASFERNRACFGTHVPSIGPKSGPIQPALAHIACSSSHAALGLTYNRCQIQPRWWPLQRPRAAVAQQAHIFVLSGRGPTGKAHGQRTRSHDTAEGR